MQARYYDPVIGRFYSYDPVDTLGHMQRGNSVHGFGRYTYANNNPYKYTDPDGKAACAGVCIAAAVVATKCAGSAGCRAVVKEVVKVVAKNVGKIAGAITAVNVTSGIKDMTENKTEMDAVRENAEQQYQDGNIEGMLGSEQEALGIEAKQRSSAIGGSTEAGKGLSPQPSSLGKHPTIDKVQSVKDGIDTVEAVKDKVVE